MERSETPTLPPRDVPTVAAGHGPRDPAFRRDRRRTWAWLLVVQAAIMAIGWGWSAAQTQNQVPLSIGTAVLVLTVTAWATARLVHAHDQRLEEINRDLERQVRHRVVQATAARDAIITGLARLADYRDSDTGDHLDRMAAYCAILAERLRDTHAVIDGAWIAQLRVASSLHDIGKVGIADAVLLKPARLDAGEWTKMRQHPVIGANTLLAVRETMGHDDLVEMALRVTLFHHERWDGTGYPSGLAGQDIPLEARIVALADVYDALTSARVYKREMAHRDAVSQIRAASGTQFDPGVVEAFVACAAEFERVRARAASRVHAGGMPDEADPAGGRKQMPLG